MTFIIVRVLVVTGKVVREGFIRITVTMEKRVTVWVPKGLKTVWVK